MNCYKLEYRINTATYDSLVTHLTEGADCFNPPLYTYVNIKKYAQKIFCNSVTFESWHESKLIGLISTYFNDNKTKTGFITNVSILSEYQGCGVASRLMCQVIEYGGNHSFTTLELELNTENTKAYKLYDKYGFVVVGQRSSKLLMRYKYPSNEVPNE